MAEHDPSDPSVLELSMFKPEKMAPGFIGIFIGMRMTGKSLTMRYVMYKLRSRFTHGIVFSRTEAANHFWGQHVPPLYIFTEFDEEPIYQLIAGQAEEINRVGRDAAGEAFIMVDDMGLDRNFTHSAAMRELAANGRQYKISVLITTQYPLSVPPEIRGNIQYVFLLREKNVLTRQKLHEHYCGEFKSLQLFEQVFRQCTENNELMVVDKTAESWELGKQVFYFRSKIDLAENNPGDPNANEFQLGNDEYRAFSAEHDSGIQLHSFGGPRHERLKKLGLIEGTTPNLITVVKKDGVADGNPFRRTPSAMYAAEFTGDLQGRRGFMHKMIDAQNEKYQETKGAMSFKRTKKKR